VGKIARPPQVSELALERLRNDIVEDNFKLGEKLSEGQLALRYGVTKAPIRSAFIRLQGEGLLEVRPQSGTFVFSPDMKEVRALCELRIALESEAILLAMHRNSQVLLKRLGEIFRKMDACLKAGNKRQYQSLDTAYHLAILESAKSPMLEATYQAMVNSRFSALRNRLATQRAHADNSYREHKMLIEMVRTGKIAEAQQLLRDHIGRTEEHYVSMLKGG
jgi:DNA-binding GntR family transcriptional regulator